MWYVTPVPSKPQKTSTNVVVQIGWTVPFAWGGVWALVTTKWVQMSLAQESKMWTEERNKAQLP
jgi:hypothetical protein